MPFRREVYDSPHTGTIADLIGAPGRREAQRLRENAEAQARADMMAGQAWGNAATTIGQAISGAAQMYQQQQLDKPRRELLAQQVRQGQQTESDRTALDAAFKSGLDRDGILKSLPGHLQGSVLKMFADADESAMNVKKAKDAMAVAERDYLGSIAAGVKAFGYDPQAAQIALQHAKEAGYDVTQIVQQLQRDPSRLQQVVDQLIAQSPKQMELQQAAGRNAETARHNTALEAQAKTTAEQAAADRTADNARQAATATEAARHNRAMEARPIGGQRPIAVLGPDGKSSVFVPPQDAIGKTPAPSNAAKETSEDERKSSGWYRQMAQAIRIMDDVEDTISEQELYQIQTLPQEGLIGMANRGELSENAKRYLRAFEQFTEARLRSVSGAAISAGEYAGDRRTYAKQYGETSGLNKDRRSARDNALSTLRTRAGRAYVETPAEDGPTARPTPGGLPSYQDYLKSKGGR